MPDLPFPLPRLTAGYAALTAGAREVGREAAARAAAALASELGAPVEVAGRALSGPADGALGAVSLGLSFGDPRSRGLLEVDAGLAARLADLLAGGAGEAPPAATALSPLESSALELLALCALAGVAGTDAAARLAPRLVREVRAVPEALVVELQVAAGPVRGNCRLLVPAEVVRALSGPGSAADLDPAVRVPGWLESGSVRLDPSEVAALAEGDAILLDDPPSQRVLLHLPGLSLSGLEADGTFRLEESMSQPDGIPSLLVAVEIAQLEVPLGDLALLVPGAALPLHAPRDGRVALRAGGRRIAVGRLVEVEGALGVLVERMVEAPLERAPYPAEPAEAAP